MEKKPTEPEMSAAYIDQLLSQQPANNYGPPKDSEAQSQKPKKPLRIPLLILGCLLVAAICLPFFIPGSTPAPEPVPTLSNDQWVDICREAYNQLYQSEQLHFTCVSLSNTPTGTSMQITETWFSGENYYQKQTLRDGSFRASALKDGTYYYNGQPMLYDSGWRISTEDPAFTRSNGAWEEGKYALERVENIGSTTQVIFSRDVSDSSLQLRIHYLTFQFHSSEKPTAIVFENVLFSGMEADRERVSRSISDEYIFHDTTTQQIMDALNTPLQSMENHRLEDEKWSSICAAVFEEFCSRTVLHYTMEKFHSSNLFHPTNTEEGWICGTDSARYTFSQGTKNSREDFCVEIGSEGYQKRNSNGEEGSWQRYERKPSMHIYFQQDWNPHNTTFVHAQSSTSGTEITFFYVRSSSDTEYIIFRLDPNNQLQGIRIQNSLYYDVSRITEYWIHDVTEAEAHREIDKFYKMAINGE